MPLRIYVAILAVLSFLTYVLYGADKRRAVEGQWRISEKTLLAFSLLGGALGGYLAMKTLRHKTRHWYFHFANIVGILWQVGLLVYLILLEI